jgi:molybdenum cofactor guanylyltransferase
MGGMRKPLVALGGLTVLERQLDVLRPLFREIVLCSDEAGPFASFGLPVLVDREPGKGPLPAIAEALDAVRAPALFVVAGDMPDIAAPPITLVVRRLHDGGRNACDAAVPLVGGFFEPLFAAYRRSCLPAIERALAAGRLRVGGFYDEIRVALVAEDELRRLDPGLAFLHNLNQPGDLAQT